MAMATTLETPRIYDHSYADGGYVIFDYGAYATAYEYVPSIDVFDRFGDGDDEARDNEDIVIRRELLLEQCDLLHRARNAVKTCGWTSSGGREWMIEALLAYGYCDSDPWQRWQHGIRLPYTPNRLLDACKRENVEPPGSDD